MMDAPRQPDDAALTFADDAGASRSKWVAGGLALAIVAWMGSGYLIPSAHDDGEAGGATAAMRQPVSVAVMASQAQTIPRIFSAEGQALPDRDTSIRAETSGLIAEILVAKGADLASGEPIARFAPAARQSDLARAEEELRLAQREYENAQALLARGVATADRVAQARAALASAQAGVTAANEAVTNTEIRAPFAGRLEALEINEGEYITIGDDIGRIVDNAPLTVRIQIPQQAIRDIRQGQTAQVAFMTGESAAGVVTFIGSSADAQTRTFTADIDIPNEDGAIPAGISAQLQIPTGEITAHFISPAILSLDTDGALGVKTVDAQNSVVFHPVEIVRAQTDGIWVSGLPDAAQIITIGQGFVNDGETVAPTVQEGDPEALVDPAEAGLVASPDVTTGTSVGDNPEAGLLNE
ncbi:efflux RND transporter periplasmic adaptor subunit [Albirhodobacter sp. R86504]|uniref:efflux RND transporter periplasmic adaptor subunit n=1 Tax=Albirhodobacter sp. R86504 TaxID=3093848 RepID=UPI00366ECD2B